MGSSEFDSHSRAQTGILGACVFSRAIRVQFRVGPSKCTIRVRSRAPTPRRAIWRNCAMVAHPEGNPNAIPRSPFQTGHSVAISYSRAQLGNLSATARSRAETGNLGASPRSRVRT